MDMFEFETRRMGIVYFRPCLFSCFFVCHSSNADHDWEIRSDTAYQKNEQTEKFDHFVIIM